MAMARELLYGEPPPADERFANTDLEGAMRKIQFASTSVLLLLATGNGADADFRAFATKRLPLWRMHLQMAKWTLEKLK
jgi:hypothetical protein